MIIKSITIKNYKSMGKERNTLLVGPAVTAIIGKNESGKSNIIDAFEEFDFDRYPYQMEDIRRKKHRGMEEDPVAIELMIAEPDNVREKTFVRLTENGMQIKGDFVRKVLEDGALADTLKELRKLNGADYGGISAHYEEWMQCNPYHLTRELQAELEKIKRKIQMRADGEHRKQKTDKTERLLSLYETLSVRTALHVSSLPYIVCGSNAPYNSFKELYYMDELGAMNKQDILAKLLRVSKIAWNEIVQLMSSRSSLLLAELNEKLDRVSLAFSRFSGIETFLVRLAYREDYFMLTAQTAEGEQTFDELSVSLKWYFALYVDLISRNISADTVVFVLESPGIFMHVNGQKELMAYISALTKMGHQVIYTTHSPFLINTDKIGSLRAVEKIDGQTFIHNKIYYNDLSEGSKMETLTPIFEAMGVSMGNMQPAGGERLNIIVEGISDYYYLQAMLYYFGFEGSQLPNIIPSVGVSNITNIASILIGWGAPFKVVVDCDFEGKKAADKMTGRLRLRMGHDIVYVNCAKKYIPKQDKRIEDLLDARDKSKINISRSKKSKALFSKEFLDRVQDESIALEDFTVQNFARLFRALGLKID